MIAYPFKSCKADLLEVTVQQALERLAVTGLVLGHLMHSVVHSVIAQFLKT